MIRKMLVASAAAVLPITGLAGVALVASSGSAGAAGVKPTPTPVTCAIGGSIGFSGNGISVDGDANTSKTATTNVTMTSSTTGCAASTTVAITQKSTKCTAISFGSVSAAGLTIYPETGTTASGPYNATDVIPGCAPTVIKPGKTKATKNYLGNTAWGFAGGELVNGVSTPSTAGILAALKKGTPFNDNGTTWTLLPTAVNQELPGGICGAGAGFSITGGIKKATGAAFNLTLCLSGDTGTNTTNAFVTDLTAQLLNFSGVAPDPGSAITSATIDSTASSLVITG